MQLKQYTLILSTKLGVEWPKSIWEEGALGLGLLA